MDQKRDSVHLFGRRKAALAAGSAVTLASILWVVARREDSHESAEQPKTYENEAAILLEERLRDKRLVLNRLAAQYLHLPRPSMPVLMEALETSRNKVSHLSGYLLSHGLIQRAPAILEGKPAAYYQPTEALEWAAGQPDRYTELTQELGRLAAPGTENRQDI